jgi:hypothetical protein
MKIDWILDAQRSDATHARPVAVRRCSANSTGSLQASAKLKARRSIRIPPIVHMLLSAWKRHSIHNDFFSFHFLGLFICCKYTYSDCSYGSSDTISVGSKCLEIWLGASLAEPVYRKRRVRSPELLSLYDFYHDVDQKPNSRTKKAKIKRRGKIKLAIEPSLLRSSLIHR